MPNAARLNPVFEEESEAAGLVTQFMAAVPLSSLVRKAGMQALAHNVISGAVDMAKQGF